ncbi:MAG: ThuA domain-containing protein [Planctomycetaceae bacterium]|nr:ThuA domain-containing protein [Planctomycetaceae bacterium]
MYRKSSVVFLFVLLFAVASCIFAQEKKDEKPADVYQPEYRFMPDRAMSQSDKDLIRDAVWTLSDKPPAAPKKERNLMIFDLNLDFEGHRSAVCANYAFQQIAERTKAFKVTIAHEAKAFEAENLKTFDAVIFNNTVGNVFTEPEYRKNLEDFVMNGGGVIGLHSAVECFVIYGGENKEDIGKDDWADLGDILGARGMKHRETDEKVFIKVEVPDSPLAQSFPKEGFYYKDEILRFTKFSRKDIQVLLSLDNAKSNLNRPPYQDVKEREDGDYALAWIRNVDKGRLCYIALGHNPYHFWDPMFLEFYLRAAQYVMGDL